jgi:single-stranded-DNA-specific exonuclease
MVDEAEALVENLPLGEGALPPVFCLHDAAWHPGVVGLVASRLKDRLHRPVVAFAPEEPGSERLKGSARSIPGIHIRDILDVIAARHPGLVTRFGGHAMAAGLTLPHANYKEFAAAFEAEVARHADDVQLQAMLESDGELSPEDFQLPLATELRFAGPWGQHFPEPMFDGRFTLVQQRLVGEKHLKLVLSPLGSGLLLDAIAFNIDPTYWPNQVVTEVEIVYRLDVNDYRGQQSVQLVIEQLQPH